MPGQAKRKKTVRLKLNTIRCRKGPGPLCFPGSNIELFDNALKVSRSLYTVRGRCFQASRGGCARQSFGMLNDLKREADYFHVSTVCGQPPGLSCVNMHVALKLSIEDFAAPTCGPSLFPQVRVSRQECTARR